MRIINKSQDIVILGTSILLYWVQVYCHIGYEYIVVLGRVYDPGHCHDRKYDSPSMVASFSVIKTTLEQQR